MDDIIYILGHKNPDTDSICSAIAYAEFKKKIGINAIPVRIGNINKETEFVLNYFEVEVPDYLESVRTQVSDLNIDVINPVSADISIKTAWNVMQKNKFKVLPVADENGKLLGVTTLSDITSSYMDAQETNILSASNTHLNNIIETLNARLISGNDTDFKTTGKTVIAAMAPESMEPFIEKGDIVLVGDRKDNQIKAISIGASCIILTCGGQIDEDVLELAKEKGCIVMETAYDTFTTARMINQSIPVGFIMTKKDLVCFNINDYVDTIRDMMLQKRYRSYPVVDDDYVIKGFISRYHLISQKRKKVILLDHNERAQTISGIDQAEILEIIDHHRIGDIQTSAPVYFKNDTVGSTSTLIANIYFDNGIRPSYKIAGILCAAIISDTMKFRSPTSTYADKLAATRLAKIANIDIDDFSKAMFKASSSLKGMNPQEILNYDFKEFNINKHKIGIGQVNSSDHESFSEMKPELIDYMEKVMADKDFDLVLLMATDPVNDGSEIIITGNDSLLVKKAFHAAPEANSVYLKGVVSRKKQVIPMVTEAIQSKFA
jgi:manganese-dependent inorganic pyrophosphatase